MLIASFWVASSPFASTQQRARTRRKVMEYAFGMDYLKENPLAGLKIKLETMARRYAYNMARTPEPQTNSGQ